MTIKDITREFKNTSGIKVFYNDTTGNFEIDTGDEIHSIYDDGPNAAIKVQIFIDELYAYRTYIKC